jgi:hypothetical protein
MAEVFSDDLNLKIGDLLSRHLSHSISAKKGPAPHNIMTYAKPLLVVGCTCRFALCTKQGTRLGCVLNGSKLWSWETTQAILLHDMNSINKSFPAFSLHPAPEREFLHNMLLL